jgi:hypothetical protein
VACQFGHERRREEGTCLHHCLVCWFVCLMVCFLIILNFFWGKIFTVFEVLEKNLEASFYFSVLQQKKKKQWKSCSFI